MVSPVLPELEDMTAYPDPKEMVEIQDCRYK